MIFVIIIISAFLGAILFYFYRLYRNRTISKGKILLSIESNKIDWFTPDAVMSVFLGIVTLFFIVVSTVSTLRGYRADFMGWLGMLSAILFFGLYSYDYFPTNGKRTLIFTDKGIIYWNMFYSWHEIEGYHWKPNSKGTTYSLKFSFTPWSLKPRVFGDYYSLDINTVQKIDKILDGKVMVKVIDDKFYM